MKFKIVFEVACPSGDFKMYRIFKTESLNMARTEGKDLASILSSEFVEFTFIEVEPMSL